MNFSIKNIKHFDQIAFWCFMFLLTLDYHYFNDNLSEAIGVTFFEMATYMLVAYLNFFVLLPKLLEQKRILSYIGAVLLLKILLAKFIQWIGMSDYSYDYQGFRYYLSVILNYSLYLLLSTLYRYYQKWQMERENQLHLKSEKLEAELKFLKTQISPHFLFNTLNNIYTLAYQKHDNAAPMVAKLSNIMRYILTDCRNEKVSLQKELENIQHFIDLHLLRKPRSQNIDFYIEGEPNGLQIAPLLLINFVENCFKHSDIDKNENAFVKVECLIEKEQIHFRTENSKERNGRNSEQSGIGLENVQRQLELNYLNQFELKIEEERDVFIVGLKINLGNGYLRG